MVIHVLPSLVFDKLFHFFISSKSKPSFKNENESSTLSILSVGDSSSIVNVLFSKMMRCYGADTTEKMLIEHVKECGKEAMKLVDVITEIFNGERPMIKTFKEIFENIERKEYNSSGKKEFLLDVISSLIIDEFLKSDTVEFISYIQYETLDSRHIFVEELVEYLHSYEKKHHKLMILILLVCVCEKSNLFPFQTAYCMKNILKENQDDQCLTIFCATVVRGIILLFYCVDCIN
jgi:hypothetical protein